MEIYIISFGVYLLTALAIGIGIMWRGRPMHAGCRKQASASQCKSAHLCGGLCRSDKDV